MGLFSKIKKALGSTDDDAVGDSGLEAVRKEMRSHTRYPISFFKDTSVSISDGWCGSIMDISYGGIAVRFDSDRCDFSKSIPVLADCELSILGEHHKFQMKTVRTIPHSKEHLYVGFCFNHSSADTLIFLREVIEPIRHGRTIEPLGQDFRAERYRGKQWHCFRGDGPIDLIFQTGTSGTSIVEALLTFKSGDRYFEVGYQNEKFWTSKSLASDTGSGPLSTGSQMIPTVALDEALLRRAILILASVPVKSVAAIQPLLDLVSAAVKKQVKGAA